MPNIRQSLAFKIGSTFRVNLAYTPTVNLAPADLSGVTITSSIRTPEGKLVATLTVTKSGDNMSFQLECTDTSTWPSEKFCLWDVKFVDTAIGGYGTFYTETIELRLEEAQS